MIFRGKALASITAPDIQIMIDNKVGESRTLDYKQEIKLDEGGKVDILYDITAFFNTEGGFLIVGLAEEKDANGKNTGVPRLPDTPVKVSNYDQLQLHLQNLLRDATNPAIGNIEFSPLIALDSDHDVFVMGIPVTLNLPSMVKYKNMSRFYKRSSNGNYLLDTYELSQLFTRAAEREQRVQEFINSRRQQVFVDDLFPGLAQLPAMLLHIVPLAYFGDTMPAFSEADFKRKAGYVLTVPHETNYSDQYFYDGLRAYTSEDRSDFRAYNLLFRDGTLETFSDGVFYPMEENRPSTLSLESLIMTLAERLQYTLDFYRQQGREGSYLVSLSFNHVRNFILATAHNHIHRGKYPRQVLTLPVVTINDDVTVVKTHMKGLMDIILQAFNFNACPQPLFDKYFNTLQ